jgi:hypothetical protein
MKISLRMIYMLPLLIIPLSFALLYQFEVSHSLLNFIIVGLTSVFLNLVCILIAILMYKDFFLNKYGSYSGIISYHITLVVPLFMLYFIISFCIATTYGVSFLN